MPARVPASVPAFSPAFAPGVSLHDRYLLERRIGSGGMAQVWRARDLVLGREVAVKTVTGQATLDPALRAGSRREAQAAAKLTHQHITGVHDYAELELENGQTVPYLVMELLHGETLADRIARGPIPWPQAATIGGQIASALTAAHALGVVHQDIKPANIFLTPTGVKVLDFGIAAMSGHRENTDWIIGTPAYAPPERLRQAPPDPAADVFGLGATMCEMVTGRQPFPIHSWDDATRCGYAPPALPPSVPPQAAAVILAAVDPAPQKRPTVAAMSRSFSLETPRPPSGPPASAGAPTLLTPTGAITGSPPGAAIGFPPGTATGSPNGTVPSFSAGAAAGFPNGTVPGSSAGAGFTNGTVPGSSAGAAAGSPIGAPAGTGAGFPAGAVAGSPAAPFTGALTGSSAAPPGGPPSRTLLTPTGAAAGSAAVPQRAQTQIYQPPARVRKGTSPWLIAGVAVAVLAVVLGAVFILGGILTPRDKKPSALPAAVPSDKPAATATTAPSPTPPATPTPAPTAGTIPQLLQELDNAVEAGIADRQVDPGRARDLRDRVRELQRAAQSQRGNRRGGQLDNEIRDFRQKLTAYAKDAEITQQLHAGLDAILVRMTEANTSAW
jgi:hypothetical protein